VRTKLIHVIEKNIGWKATLARRLQLKQPSNATPAECQLFLNQKSLWVLVR
jgi:hypothetical protein